MFLIVFEGNGNRNMAKRERHGKSTPISEEIYRKLRKACKQDEHKLLFDIAYYTGERIGAIVQLKVSDVYQDSDRRKLHRAITYRAATRKDRATRQVPIHPELQLKLRAYDAPQAGWLFPGRGMHGHLCVRAADRMLRRRLADCGLEDDGISLHGFRHGFISDLHKQGLDLKIIASLTGHKSLQVLAGYVAIGEDQRAAAIALR